MAKEKTRISEPAMQGPLFDFILFHLRLPRVFVANAGFHTPIRRFISLSSFSKIFLLRAVLTAGASLIDRQFRNLRHIFQMMGTKDDIRDAADIRLLVDRFYDKVRGDETIGYIFNDIAGVNWPAHLPQMYSFWEMVIFQTGAFKGNPMAAHIRLHQKHPLMPVHFERWLQLFNDTVNELFGGEKAELAKKQAASVAGIMLAKIGQATRVDR